MPRTVPRAAAAAVSARIALALAFAFALALPRPAGAATWYVSPTGTAETGCDTRANPCALGRAAAGAVAGDTVVLMDGVYKQPLFVTNSGTASAWITFKADECATPIVEGAGAGPDDDVQDSGVHSTTGEYLRFVGIVARGWNIGFGNAWAGGVESTAVSNGHWDIEYCASYSNGRTGFTFFSAAGFHLKNSISAHNGSSRVHSWSSGVTLFEATGTNLVEGNISFENTDAERRTDGSGFIVDEASNGATFVNNIAFGNSGSCLRLTKSSGTRFVNNTCYRNSQFGSMATGPSNPSELYFTNAGVTVQGVTFTNNVIVGTGQAPAGAQPVVNMPTSGWSNNVVTTGMPTFFTAPTGTNPNFVPASGDTMLIGKGASGNAVPTTDIGLDPKCIVKRTPIMVGQVARVATWQYDVDIDYIKSIGGVAKCFNPKPRSGTPDVGAYRPGAVTTVTAGSCVPPPITGAGGTGGSGGAGGAGGATGAGTGGATSAGSAGTGGRMAGTGGGAAGTGGGAGRGGAGGVAGTGATTGAGGDANASGSGGATGSAGSGSAGAAGALAGTSGGTGPSGSAGTGASATGAAGSTSAPGNGGNTSATAGSTGGGATGPGADTPAGCACHVSPSLDESTTLVAFGWLAIVAGLARRRRRSRATDR
jgi:parallel beta-helix repeat protein